MILGDSGAYLGLLSFFSFSFSVIAAVLAIDMYTLLRTGELGKTWRILIIASVMFALAQVVRMAELLNWRMSEYGLSQIVELVFVLALAYAFFLQRQTFTQAAQLRGEKRRGLARKPANELPEADADTTSDRAAVISSGQQAAQNTTRAQPSDVTAAGEGDALGPLEDENDSEIEWSHSAPRKPQTVTSGSLSMRQD
jgi:hypothetical protein